MSEIRVTSVVGENGGDRVGLTTGLTVGPLTGTTGIGATITHQGHAQFAGVCTATSFSGSGASLTGLIAGITEVDQWYLTADLTSTSDITANVARNNFAGATKIGTGLSFDSSTGYFTFPVTGKYMVIVHARFTIDSSDNVNVSTLVSLNGGGSYSAVAYASDGNNGSGNRDGASTSFYFLDVTDVSQVKVKFNHGSNSGNSALSGSTNNLQTSFTFIRMGDT